VSLQADLRRSADVNHLMKHNTGRVYLMASISLGVRVISPVLYLAKNIDIESTVCICSILLLLNTVHRTYRGSLMSAYL
jgi:hypothetical protein